MLCVCWTVFSYRLGDLVIYLYRSSWLAESAFSCHFSSIYHHKGVEQCADQFFFSDLYSEYSKCFVFVSPSQSKTAASYQSGCCKTCWPSDKGTKLTFKDFFSSSSFSPKKKKNCYSNPSNYSWHSNRISDMAWVGFCSVLPVWWPAEQQYELVFSLTVLF